MRIAMIGSGYVGLVTAVCFADVGHEVICVDIDEKKIEQLRLGHSPIYEPGIEPLILKNIQHHRLSFTTDLKNALEQASVVFIAVGTPAQEDGSADLQHVMKLAATIGKTTQSDLILVVKSTVPVGSCEEVERIVKLELQKRKATFQVVVASNPEFLKEGTAISDFMKPDRIVVGLDKKQGEEAFKKLYLPFIIDDPYKLLIVERRTSELIKYAANAMLATRISFMNEMSRLCEKLSVDIDQLRIGIGADPRIGKKFLYAGPGYGGSCFPKDVSALIRSGQQQDMPLLILQAVEEVNKQQITHLSQKIKNHFRQLEGRKIAIWGLAFKPGTDDVREAPSKTLIRFLLNHGAQVTAHDPQASLRFKQEFGEHSKLTYADSALSAVEKADALVLMTEWSEYRLPAWDKIAESMKQKVIFDFRNQYEFQSMAKAGFHYQCVGRPDSSHVES